MLIANRGEIAVRLIRACRELGIEPVAIHSDIDRSALHVREAGAAVEVGGADPADSYLNSPRIVAAALEAGCEAVHPGYGFLSENAEFAAAVESAGKIFVGPSPETIRRMGDKTAARALALSAGVPVAPGSERAVTDEECSREARRIGFPVLVKAAGGGGGRGMRLVRSASELKESLESARREAAGAFGDDRLFLEKYVEGARHVEFQILGDGRGGVMHLFERDCSVQRRHQKILEESPSTALDDELRGRMAEAALRVAGAALYRNAGTVEFLLDPRRGEFYFLEMNTRLQVEHPVTELLTGVDLVAAQIRIASGGSLPSAAGDLRPRGHVMECRLYAEDPASGFLPSAGRILFMSLPEGPGVRVDAGYATGDQVSLHYDSMLAKIIAWGEDREKVVRKMDRALQETVVLGIPTNLEFLRAVLAHSVFREGKAGTDFVAGSMSLWPGERARVPDEVLIAAALAEETGHPTAAVGEGWRHSPGPWDRGDGFRPGS
jgi:3-methylcrotonyl-CoA carboxylase alpha subunit